MAIGIRLVIKMNSLSAVVLAVVLGTIIGEALHLEARVNKGVAAIAPRVLKNQSADDAFINTFIAVAMLFCCSGTGWYGVLNEGFTGDGTILITKAILVFHISAIALYFGF